MGIGRAFAEACARRGMNLILVALPGIELDETADFIRTTYQVEVNTFPVDLSQIDGPQKVYDFCNEHHYSVNFLINNAGAAGTAVFEHSPLKYSDMRIMVNVRALVLLSRIFIPMMKNLPGSYILNIGSMGAFYPIPYKSVYSASKMFVVTFSRAIREELRNTNISISVVCPNGVETNSGTYGRIKAHGMIGKYSKIDKDALAEYTLQKMYKGKSVIIPKRINRVMKHLNRIIPTSLTIKFLKKEFEKEVRVSS